MPDWRAGDSRGRPTDDSAESSKRAVRRQRFRLRVLLSGTDRASATVPGIVLIAVAGLFIGCVGVAGRLMYEQSVVQAAADSAAIGAAGQSNGLVSTVVAPCAQAEALAQKNGSQLVACVLDGSDVQVAVKRDTGVPLLAQVQAKSRAGPAQDCGR